MRLKAVLLSGQNKSLSNDGVIIGVVLEAAMETPGSLMIGTVAVNTVENKTLDKHLRLPVESYM